MANLLGLIVTLVTFPGVILHEWAHKLFCELAGVPVYEVKYFSLGNPAGFVRHGSIDRYRDVFLVTIAPFIINSLFATAMFMVSFLNLNTLVNILFIWLGASFAMHAFPSDGDAKHLWKESRARWRQNPIALLGLPLVLVIFVANLLRIFWFDLLYAFTLWGIALSIVGILLFAGSAATSGLPWFTTAAAPDSVSGYSYVKEHTIWSRTSELSDYQLMYVIHKGAGRDNGNDVYLNGHAYRWPNDILFTDEQDRPLSYWVESYDEDSANVWVKVNTISTKDTTIKLYYGKFVDRGASDAESTFPFFDDFDTLNSTRWTVTGNPALSDGQLTLLSTGEEQGIESLQGFGEGYAIRARIKSGHFRDTGHLEWFGLLNMTDHESGSFAFYSSNNSLTSGKYVYFNDRIPCASDIRAWQPGQYFVHENSRKDCETDWSVDDLNAVGFSAEGLPGDTNIVAATCLKDSRIDLDWVLVHKTIRYLPTEGDWSSERWLAIS